MSMYAKLNRELQSTNGMNQLNHLYGSREGQLLFQSSRYASVLKKHEEKFNYDGEVKLISAPGRCEIGGNHTDHNNGKVLAASVNLDTLAAVSPRNDMIVNLQSDGYRPLTVDLSDLSVNEQEYGTTAALIRGVAAGMAERGLRIGGFDAIVRSTVASGSGLSSSAAFEVMLTGIFDELYNGFTMNFIDRAIIGKYAENVYFGKPSGLLDQMASAAGGLVTIDFKNEADPKVKALGYDFAAKGYALVVVGTGGSHANLTDAYAAIPSEMKQVAAHFNRKVLREVRVEEFQKALPELFGKVPDRAILRAMHFYAENPRVDQEVAALESDNLQGFLDAIIDSGRSSYQYLQNIYAYPTDQSLSVALAIAEQRLKGKGAWRIHGGGFAGTTLNFVPEDLLPAFTAEMNSIFGNNSCHVLDIRPEGAAVLRF